MLAHLFSSVVGAIESLLHALLIYGGAGAALGAVVGLVIARSMSVALIGAVVGAVILFGAYENGIRDSGANCTARLQQQAAAWADAMSKAGTIAQQHEKDALARVTAQQNELESKDKQNAENDKKAAEAAKAADGGVRCADAATPAELRAIQSVGR